jgi:L-alanine-DL-glutamate epimerase-like enolase superfamily enzyme
MNRRDFLGGVAAPLALAPRAQVEAPRSPGRIKITDVRVVPLRIAKQIGTLEPAWALGRTMNYAIGGGSFLEIHTDKGLVGIGPDVDPTVIPGLKSALIGKDPFDTEQFLAQYRFHTAAGPQRTAPVDIALWDLIGKACNQPVYKLLGAAKESVTCYASMVQLSTPEERARMAVQLADEGWKAIKLRLKFPTMKEDIAVVEAVRKAIGNRMEILTDANQAGFTPSFLSPRRWDLHRAEMTARELERLGCYYLEEPLPQYAFDDLAELRRRVSIPIAGGESCRGFHEFFWMMQKGAYDIIQAEVVISGGITGLRKIAAVAEAFNKYVIPHNGNMRIGNVAHLHLVASWPNGPYLEVLHDPPIGDYRHNWAIFKTPPMVQNGEIRLPQGPGLGVEMNPDLIQGT